MPRTDVIGHTDPYVLLHVIQGASELKIKWGCQRAAIAPLPPCMRGDRFSDSIMASCMHAAQTHGIVRTWLLDPLQCRTGAIYNAANPAWSDEEVHLSSVQPGCSLHFEVYDHNTMYADAFSCSSSGQCLSMDRPQFKVRK